jgi:hypothetical protein
MVHVATVDSPGEAWKSIALRCDQAQLLLQTIDLDATSSAASLYTNGQKAAVRHYFSCKKCAQLGMSAIVGVELACQESLLAWAGVKFGFSSGFVPFGAADTIREAIALEHIFGRWICPDAYGQPVRPPDLLVGRFDQCECDPCRKTVAFVELFGGWSLDVANNYQAFLLDLFYSLRWDLEPLLAVHKAVLLSFNPAQESDVLRIFNRLTHLVLWWNERHDIKPPKLPKSYQLLFDWYCKELTELAPRDAVRAHCEHRSCCGGGGPEDDCGIDCHAVFHSIRALAQFVADRKEHKGPLSRWERGSSRSTVE